MQTSNNPSGAAAVGMGARIEARLREALEPAHLALLNESGNHSVPKGSETHWNLVIVAEAFEGKRTVARQRAVYGALKAELAEGLHALTMRTLTPAEWAAAGGAPLVSPPCHGGTGL